MKKVLVILLIVILIVVIGVMGYLQYQSNELLDIAADKITQLKDQVEQLQKDVSQKPSPEVTVKAGDYTVDQISLDAGGVSNEGTGFCINDDGTFSVFMGWGFGHSGTYEIQGKELICTSDLFYWESGSVGERATNVVFTFDASTPGTLKLMGIQIYDEDTDKLILSDAITPGWTYSIKDIG